MLIKNKMELARSVANSICSHNGLFGLRSIWQNQIAHHTTELTLRLNQESSVGITTRLRLKDAQIKCKSKFSLLDSRYKFIVNQIKNNLTYNIIQSISKLGFSFQETQTETNNIEIKGVEISSLLEKKALKGFLESKNLSIFTTNQLIEEEGNKLLSWQQICMLRGRKAKGCKPNWFKAIEEILLKNKATREVIKEFKLEGKNLEAIKARRQKISKDKRRKE